MSPPALAQALITATAPSGDYEIVAGDLHEEYLRIRYFNGAKAANRWYWTQALFSIPSLLSYSRSKRSALRHIGVALIALGVLFAMLTVLAVIETLFQKLPDVVWFCYTYADALIFGAILAWLVRTDGLRVTLFASVFLVLCFVIPALAGNPHSQAPPSAWIVLLGAIPVMCIGAAIYQVARRKADSPS